MNSVTISSYNHGSLTQRLAYLAIDKISMVVPTYNVIDLVAV